MRRSRSLLPSLVAIVLAAAAGWWFGARRAPPAEITVVACPEVNRCLDASPAPSKPRVPAAAAATRSARPKSDPSRTDLPKLGPVDEPREELLQYIRDHADALVTCASGTERARMTLQLDVVSGGAIRTVRMLDGNAAAKRASSCVTERLGRWVLPSQWVPEDRTLLVSLVL